MQIFIESCDVCKILKGKSLAKPISIKEAPIPSRPFYQVSVGISDPLPLANDGHRYILTVISFSRVFR